MHACILTCVYIYMYIDHGPILVSLNIRCRIIMSSQKGSYVCVRGPFVAYQKACRVFDRGAG